MGRITELTLCALLLFSGCKPIDKGVQHIVKKRMGADGAYIQGNHAYCRIGKTKYFTMIEVGNNPKESLTIAAHYAMGISFQYPTNVKVVDESGDGYITADEVNKRLSTVGLGAKFD